MTIRYRPDIDGLRAIAVLSVVFYHYGIGPLHGGFVGVDVFYVISGFLITGIIHREMEEGRFTYASFYERRVRRIFPALFAMLAATLALGFWLLLPSDFASLGERTIATLLFGSNVLFWLQSGYFDPSADLNPLLHTWSLAVEEQFYIVFPIFLILVRRFAPRALKALLVLGAAASLALCVYYQGRQPDATFFLSPFRGWELALGGLVALEIVGPITNRWAREGVSAAAFAVLLASVCLIQAGHAFPGWHAAIPVVAVAVLIHTGRSVQSSVHRILAWRPLISIGLISYSLYLWHWPLLVFARYSQSMAELAGWQKFALLALALLLAWASYRWIETPLRRPRLGKDGPPARAPVFLSAAAATAAIAIVAAAATLNQGFAARFDARVRALDASRTPAIPFLACTGQPPRSTRGPCVAHAVGEGASGLLWGDSHALAWAPAFDAANGPGPDGGTVLALKSACPPLIDVATDFGSGCRSFNDEVFEWIKRSHPQRVFLVAAWGEYSNRDALYMISSDRFGQGNEQAFAPALRATIERIRPYTGQIVLIADTPGAPDQLPLKLALAAWRHSAPPQPVPSASVAQRSARFWAAVARLQSRDDVVLVDPTRWFCDDRSCRYAEGSRVLYRDNGHLSAAGADFVGIRLRDILTLRFQSARSAGEDSLRQAQPSATANSG